MIVGMRTRQTRTLEAFIEWCQQNELLSDFLNPTNLAQRFVVQAPMFLVDDYVYWEEDPGSLGKVTEVHSLVRVGIRWIRHTHGRALHDGEWNANVLRIHPRSYE
jgi:hypothetical protein